MLTFGTNRGALSIICNLLFLNGLLPFCNNSVMPGGWYIGTTAILYAITPVVLKLINKENKLKVFFLVSSILGMAVWVILFLLFRDTFIEKDFGYFLFIVHYPEYLLGIILYYNFTQKSLSKAQIPRFVLLSIVSLIIAIILFYIPLQWMSIPSAWMTGLATYFALYILLCKEKDIEQKRITKPLINWGRNSYYIFLLHSFFVWPFVHVALSILNKLGVQIIVSFFALLPITLCLAYFAGFIFRVLIVKVTKKIFKV